MGNNPSRYKGDNFPVDDVRWDDCQKFCMETGLRFPSEAQWEYACRAGTKSSYCFGENMIPGLVNHGDSGKSVGPRPIDSFDPNRFGLHNMHGNVSEWCEDSYCSYKELNSLGLNPVQEFPSSLKICRGGSWKYGAFFCRSAQRCCLSHSGLEDHGFRPAFYPLP